MKENVWEMALKTNPKENMVNYTLLHSQTNTPTHMLTHTHSYTNTHTLTHSHSHTHTHARTCTHACTNTINILKRSHTLSSQNITKQRRGQPFWNIFIAGKNNVRMRKKLDIVTINRK